MKSHIQDHPEYWLFHSMKKRCSCVTNEAYKYYGGRGITVCDRWLLPNGEGFKNFVSDMGPRPSGLTLERKDNDKGYSPDNCIWATRAAQYANRRGNINISFNGTTKTATQWAKAIGLRGGDVIKKRLANGIQLEEALTNPRLKRPIPKSAIDAAAELKRKQTHCARGHEYTLENTRTYNGGGRTCLECKRITKSARDLLKKQI